MIYVCFRGFHVVYECFTISHRVAAVLRGVLSAILEVFGILKSFWGSHGISRSFGRLSTVSRALRGGYMVFRGFQGAKEKKKQIFIGMYETIV